MTEPQKLPLAERRDALQAMLAEGVLLKVAAWRVGVSYRTAVRYKAEIAA